MSLAYAAYKIFHDTRSRRAATTCINHASTRSYNFYGAPDKIREIRTSRGTSFPARRFLRSPSLLPPSYVRARVILSSLIRRGERFSGKSPAFSSACENTAGRKCILLLYLLIRGAPLCVHPSGERHFNVPVALRLLYFLATLIRFRLVPS